MRGTVRLYRRTAATGPDGWRSSRWIKSFGRIYLYALLGNTVIKRCGRCTVKRYVVPFHLFPPNRLLASVPFDTIRVVDAGLEAIFGTFILYAEVLV